MSIILRPSAKYGVDILSSDGDGESKSGSSRVRMCGAFNKGELVKGGGADVRHRSSKVEVGP